MSEKTTIEYDDQIVRWFLLASVIFALVAFTVGLLIAFQLNFHVLNFKTEWLTFGRLRPLHTNAAIFAFVGNMMFAGIYYSTQRLCKVRMASNFLSKLHFYGWQLIIVAAAITLPLGFSRGKEYAELIWPINIAVALIWVVFGINFFWTLLKRNEKTIYVALWFYIATIITVAMLYIVNHLSLPTSFTHSYPLFAGVQDALVQWWYGHNAVAFFLTTPILGIMYYFLPKAAERPVYSYRLSVIHFWSLVFLYIWAGPHHLLNTALPSWLQYLGVTFSLMLWAPSWGGMLNGLLTLRGAWDKLRTDPVLKFMIAAITFYGMATFEGPLLAIRSVNALSHYSDWTIGHVHAGTLGWNGFMAAGMFYFLIPRLWGTKLYSTQLANLHFWIGLFGILIYVGAMWTSGIQQGLMLNAVENGVLVHPQFLETLDAIRPEMLFRAIGGSLYFVAFVIGSINMFLTIKSGKPVNGCIDVYVEDKKDQENMGLVRTFLNPPVIYSALLILFVCMWLFGDGYTAMRSFVMSIIISAAAIVHFIYSKDSWIAWYEKLLANSIPFTILTFFAVAIGGAVQILPTLTVQTADNMEGRIQVVRTPLEQEGRDIYVSEGCYNCHSQMIRTMVSDVLRYGEYSHIGESIYNRPFQWGSKRTGPDLAREGTGISGKQNAINRTDAWHFAHMIDPRKMSGEDSNMPPYPWLAEKKVKYDSLPGKIAALRKLGTPYPEWTDEEVIEMAKKQAAEVQASILQGQEVAEADTKILALIAYLQTLGKYEMVTPAEPVTSNP